MRSTLLYLPLLVILLAAAGCSCLCVDTFVGDDAITREGGGRDEWTEGPDACRHVYLGGHGIDDEAFKRVLPNLKRRGTTYLVVCNNHVSDNSIDLIRQLDKLEALRIYNTRVTPGGVARLSGMPRLKQVWVGGPAFDPAALQHVRTSLPSVDVEIEQAY